MAFNDVLRAPDIVAPRNVLVSTYDKAGLPEFVAALADSLGDCLFYATGGPWKPCAPFSDSPRGTGSFR